MEVATAETEGTDRGPPRLIARTHPGAGLCVHIERCVVQAQRGVRAVHLDRAWQCRVLKCQNCLDEPSCTCGSLGVPDLGLHRSQRAPGRVPGEHRLETGELGDVTRLRRGAVCFDEFDGRGRVAGVFVGSSQSFGLPFGAWRIDAGCLTVGGRADATNDRVDRISVTLSVAEPLERHHADALADDCAIGAVRERAAVAALREGRRLGEAHVHHDVVERIDTAGQHQIGFAQIQTVQCRLKCRKRTRASGIDDEVAAA